jgi:glycerophosphoryl diester phosphodiesterase
LFMKIIGHRGAPSLAPENTLASFDAAVKAGCSMIELDVHVVESRLLVIHDETLNRTTNGRGALTDYRLAQLRSLDAGQGQRIPFLEEVIEQTPAQVTIQVELKGPGTAAPTAALLAQYPGRRFLVSSFSLAELQAIRPLTAHPLALLFKRPPSDWKTLATRLIPVEALHVRWDAVNASLVAEAHQWGLRLAAWTVDDQPTLQRMESLGVDAVFSNCPQCWLGLPGME